MPSVLLSNELSGCQIVGIWRWIWEIIHILKWCHPWSMLLSTEIRSESTGCLYIGKPPPIANTKGRSKVNQLLRLWKTRYHLVVLRPHPIDEFLVKNLRRRYISSKRQSRLFDSASWKSHLDRKIKIKQDLDSYCTLSSFQPLTSFS